MLAKNQYKSFSYGICYYIYLVTILFNLASFVILIIDDFVNDYQTNFKSNQLAKK